MLTSLTVENWKSFEKATLNIDALTVLIGMNASGKSFYPAPSVPGPDNTPVPGDAPNADEEAGRLKKQVARGVVATFEERHLTARAAAAAAGIDPADVQRIRNAELTGFSLARFSLIRLMHVACRLGHRVEVTVLSHGGGT